MCASRRRVIWLRQKFCQCGQWVEKTNKVDVVLPFNGELVEYLDKTMGKYGLIAMVFCVKRCKKTLNFYLIQ